MQTPALPDAARFQPGPAGLEALAAMCGESPGGETTAGAAFQAIALSCLHRFEVSRVRFVRTRDPESLHQSRVALRQLRCALSVFEEIVADELYRHFRRELRWLATATNEARDLDALAERIEDLPASLKQARQTAYALAAKSLVSSRSNRLVREVLDWVANGVWLEVRNPADRTAAAFAADSLDRLRRKLAKKGRHLRTLDDAELHKVRIAAKKLRYTASFFLHTFPGDTAQRRAERFVEAVRKLQDRLGEVQDVAVAPDTLKRLGVPRANWPALPDRAKLVKRAAAAFDRALDRKPFWR